MKNHRVSAGFSAPNLPGIDDLVMVFTWMWRLWDSPNAIPQNHHFCCINHPSMVGLFVGLPHSYNGHPQIIQVIRPFSFWKPWWLGDPHFKEIPIDGSLSEQLITLVTKSQRLIPLINEWTNPSCKPLGWSFQCIMIFPSFKLMRKITVTIVTYIYIYHVTSVTSTTNPYNPDNPM